MGVVKWAGRLGLKSWARTGAVPGYFYQAMEVYGPRVAGRPMASRLPDGSRVVCNLRDDVQRQMYFLGAYEPIEAYLFTRLVEPGSLVIDAGANVGQYTLLGASATGPSGAVHSFEPVPATFARLESNLALNRHPNVHLNRLALWDRAERLFLGLEADMAQNAGAFSVGAAKSSAVPAVEADAVRLDDYLAGQPGGRVSVVKMDVEGAEAQALDGMAEMLARDRPFILLEVNRIACERLGYEPNRLWELPVWRLGYTAWGFGLSASEWRTLPDAAGIEQGNVLFAPGELPSTLTSGWDYRGCLRWARGSGSAALRRRARAVS